MLKTGQQLGMRTSSHSNLPFAMSQRPQINWLLLCIISVFGLIALSRSYLSGKFDSATASARPNIYSSYRKLRAQAENDYLELRNLGAKRGNDYGLCGKEMENGVPCYNVSANLLAGFKDGEEFDRHCEVLRNKQRCLTRSPKDYKIPLIWPGGRDVIWSGNVKLSKDHFLSSGSKMKRLMLLEENQLAFHSNDGRTADDVRDYSNQIAKMIGLRSDNEFHQAGVRNVLDIGCGFGSFGAHLLSLKLMAVCIAAYESTGSQVQLALERGLPAIIGNFISRQLPYPSLSYDMVHCAQCGIFWDDKDGMFLIEVDRVLKPGGYFVLTSPRSRGRGGSPGSKRGSASSPFEQFIKKLCWNLLSEQDGTFIWQKTTDSHCYASSKDLFPLCKREDGLSYYKPLVKCISGTTSNHWTPIQNRSSASLEFQIHGIHPQEFSQDLEFWRSSLRNYWPLLSPLIFSDHPKRPSDEDPLPPHNMVRNVMDMNANYAGLNAALLEGRHSVWVMNVVPMGESSTLPFILDQGFAGVVHNWCEPFPTYPRTYDMLHAKGLLSHLASDKCSITDLIFDMDRILRPEGWVVISDKIGLIEKARTVAARLRWEARVVDIDNGTDQHLLLCQKPFFTN